MLKAGANDRTAIDGNPAGTDMTCTIRNLNDALRRSLPFVDDRGLLMITDGVALLGIERLTELLLNVRDYSDFGIENDPYEEHDFGTVELGVDRYFWKIDYLDGSMQHGTPDPAKASVTTRVLTIMLASEY
jgi:hypothetical protein